MEVPSGAFGKPGADQLGLVDGVIVHDEVDVEIARDIRLDLGEKVPELGRPVAWIAFADDPTGRDIERGEQ